MLSARRAAVWAPGWCKPLGEAGTPEILFPERTLTLLGDSALPNPVGCSLRDRARGRVVGGRGRGAVDPGPSGRVAGSPGSASIRAGLNPEPRTESVLSSLWVSGRS